LSSSKKEQINDIIDDMNSPNVSKISMIKGQSTLNGMNMSLNNPITPINQTAESRSPVKINLNQGNYNNTSGSPDMRDAKILSTNQIQ